MMDVLENEIIPTYYNDPKKWVTIMKNAMRDIVPYFDSNRMAHEYYEKMYDYPYEETISSDKKEVSMA
jgi:starch phosphorylase